MSVAAPRSRRPSDDRPARIESQVVLAIVWPGAGVHDDEEVVQAVVPERGRAELLGNVAAVVGAENVPRVDGLTSRD